MVGLGLAGRWMIRLAGIALLAVALLVGVGVAQEQEPWEAEVLAQIFANEMDALMAPNCLGHLTDEYDSLRDTLTVSCFVGEYYQPSAARAMFDLVVEGYVDVHPVQAWTYTDVAGEGGMERWHYSAWEQLWSVIVKPVRLADSGENTLFIITADMRGPLEEGSE